MTKLENLIYDLYFKHNHNIEYIAIKLSLSEEDIKDIINFLIKQLKEDYIEQKNMTEKTICKKLLKTIGNETRNKTFIVNALLLENVEKNKIEKCLILLEQNNFIKVYKDKNSYKYTINKNHP